MADISIASTAGGAAVGSAISPGLGTLIGGGLGLLGDIATSAFNVSEQRDNRRQMVDLSNTAHQREVVDLRKAGLNPILSVNKGAGTPGLQAPQASNPVNSAAQQAMLAAQIKNTAADTANKSVDAQTKLLGQKTLLDTQIQENLIKFNQANAGQVDWSIASTQLQKLQKERDLVGAQLHLLQLNTVGAENQAEFEKGIGGKLKPYFQLITPGVNSARHMSEMLRE